MTGRAPHYLQLISRWYSSQEDPCAAAIHEAIVSVLLENGRLTVDQVTYVILHLRSSVCLRFLLGGRTVLLPLAR